MIAWSILIISLIAVAFGFFTILWERAVELRKKLEAMMEEQVHPQYPDVDYRTLDPKKQAKDAPRVWHTDKNVEDVLLDKKGDAQPARHPQDAGVMELDTKQ